MYRSLNDTKIIHLHSHITGVSMSKFQLFISLGQLVLTSSEFI